ncbi:Fatty acyl-CoA synthetase A [Smittium mucronatum]|uniref:Fatty acyl-CoA synthetase A n=1 Tax=Smittium mucronatum TaxID=133383 RepID=A0A1R0GVS7_9FUNG|nr:Fatty acyl-CoA synthetase A [Smittium mucronatum]
MKKTYKSYKVPGSESEGYSSVKEAPNEKYLGYRPFDEASGTFGPYVFHTYSQIHKRATNLGAGIINLRLKHARDKSEENIQKILARKWPVCMYSINRVEWSLTDRALPTQSLYSVALYDTLGPQSSEYILNHSEASVIVCSLDKIHKLLMNIDKYPHVRIIISMDSLTDRQKSEESPAAFIPSPFNTKATQILREWAESKNVALYDIGQVEQIGSENPIPHHPPSPDDTYTILYTSGTTGNPKGVVTTHMNYAFSVATAFSGRGEFKNTPSFVSYSPLAHTSGRKYELFMMSRCGYTGFYSGDAKSIISDIRELNPTFMNGLPRILTRIYDEAMRSTVYSGGLKGKLAEIAVNTKISNLHKGLGYKHLVWDTLFFNSTKSIVGDKLEYIMFGTAPLEPHVLDFLRIALMAKMMNTYGMTESSAIGVGQTDDDYSVGNCGVPSDGFEVRLRDVPDMNYLVSDLPCPRGEILLRGPPVFKGYFKDEKNTKEALIGDGWLATGDIGRFDEDGSISIIDRKKALFKLSQGEYISPEKIETVITKNQLVSQAFVYGISTKNHLVAIIVPDEQVFVPWAQTVLLKSTQNVSSAQIKSMDLKQLAQNSDIKSKLLDSIRDTCRLSQLAGFEIIKSLYIEHIPFQVGANSLLTPTFKLKRFDAAKHYKAIIEEMYNE